MAPCFKSGVTLKGLRGVENTASAVADLCVCVCVCDVKSGTAPFISSGRVLYFIVL